MPFWSRSMSFSCEMAPVQPQKRMSIQNEKKMSSQRPTPDDGEMPTSGLPRPARLPPK